MISIIRLVDPNVDGCGSDVECIIQVTGDTDITNGTIDRMRKAVEAYREEYKDEWDSDGCFDAAVDVLENEGYKVQFMCTDMDIIL